MSPSPVWVLMLATSYTHKTLVSVVSTLPSAATTETPNERGRTRGQQPLLLGSSTASSRYVSLMPMQPVPAVAGCLDKALSLCFTDMSSGTCLCFRDMAALLSLLGWQEIEREGKTESAAFATPVTTPVTWTQEFWESLVLTPQLQPYFGKPSLCLTVIGEREEFRCPIGFRKDAERL